MVQYMRNTVEMRNSLTLMMLLVYYIIMKMNHLNRVLYLSSEVWLLKLNVEALTTKSHIGQKREQ